VAVRFNERTLLEAIRSENSYGLLLIVLIIDYLVLILVDSPRWGTLLRTVPVGLTVLFALHTSHASRNVMRFAAIGVLFAVASGVVVAITDNGSGIGVGYLLFAIVLVMTPVVILRRVLPKQQVDVETIFAAVDVYILIGLIYGTLYIGMARFMTNPTFLAQPGPHTPNDYVYLSFITLTTVGFGDLTPLSRLARSVVVLEALMGQIFLVVLVARLVSVYSEQNRQSRPYLKVTPARRRRRDRGGADEADAEEAEEAEGEAGVGTEVDAGASEPEDPADPADPEQPADPEDPTDPTDPTDQGQSDPPVPR
jgi:voltage-gated potassium channel